MATGRRTPGEPAGVTIALRGWKAVLVLIVLVLAPPVYGRHSFNRAAGRLGEARDSLRLHLQSRATRETLPELERLDMSKPADAARAAEAARGMRVAIDDMQARGTVLGGILFRVAYSVDGKAPLGRDPVEYYRMDYSPTIGWMTHKIRRVDPMFWNLAPWRAGTGVGVG